MAVTQKKPMSLSTIKHVLVGEPAVIVLIRSCRPGSTVVDYVVKAASIQDADVVAAENGIFNKLAENYSMIFDSKKVQTFLPKRPALWCC